MNNQQTIFGRGEMTRILAIFRKNWWIVLLIAGIAYGVGLFVVYKLTSIYGASAQILLKSNDEIKQGSIITDNGYYGSVAKTYVDNSNEKRILMSYDLIKEAVDRLNFGVSYFIVGRIRTEEAFQGLPFEVKVQMVEPSLYEQMMPFKITSATGYTLTYVKNDVETKVNGEFGKDLVTEDFHVLIKLNGKQADNSKLLQQADYMIQIHSTNTLVSRYQETMRVESPEYTNILQLSVQDVIAARGVMFLDTLIAVYIENSIEQRLEVNQNTVYYIDRQLEEVTNILNTIEDTLQDFRERNVIINLDNEGDEIFGQYINFDNRKRSLQVQIEGLNDLESYIEDNKDPQFLPPAAFFSFGDPFLDKSVTQLYALQWQYIQLQSTATLENPDMVLLDSSIARMRRNMLQYIRNNRLAIIENIKSTRLQMDSSIMKLQEIPIKQRGLINIRRDLKVNEDMYLFLLQKRASTIIARAGILPETKIIDRARSIGVVKPDRDKITYYFTGAGFILALIIVFLRVIFFARVESYDELKAVTHLPVIGEIVSSKLVEDIKLVVDSDPKSPVSESFRTVRTNLQYMLGDMHKGVIVVTSNNPGEGKTFCSINLAAILAKGQKRTVLLELDLHKPRVHKGLDIKKEIGFSTIAIGKTTIEECIFPTQVEGLDVILSGPLPPNPSEIIVSKVLTDVLEFCKARYDFVIIDTPPVGLITDAIVLMKEANVTLFVINTKFTYRNSLNTAHELVAMNKLTNFGFILNGVKRRKSRYYYNKYGYRSYGGYGMYGQYGGYGGYGSEGSYGGYGERGRPKKKN
jgi:capsular exopolysaccharide synthesis family protein